MFDLDPAKQQKLAEDYFLQGYNCSQSIVLSFKNVLNIDENVLSKMSSPFGGGMGRLRETCGALSAALLVIGSIYGYSTPETGAKKQKLYERVQYFAHSFEKEFGFLQCRQLLHLDVNHDTPIPSKRDENFYKSRPCKNIIGVTAYLLAEYLNKNPKED